MKTVNDIMDDYYQGKLLEEWTYENIVLHIRRDELMRIINGENAVNVIPVSNQRRKLIRDGVLVYLYGANGKYVTVTDRARGLLVGG